MPSVPDEAPLCKKALRPLHRERERHEVLQGEASSKGVTEPDVRGHPQSLGTRNQLCRKGEEGRANKHSPGRNKFQLCFKFSVCMN